MADLLPSSPDPDAGDDGDPRVIGVDSDDADELLAALQSDTARNLLAALYDDPATPSALADEVDTSIQNVRYHLEKLTDADLVEVADTVYSEKGREMKVYAPAAKPLVVFAGSDDETPGLEAALSRLLGGLGVLGLSSLLVQRFFGSGPLTPDVTFQGGGSGAESSGSEDVLTTATTSGDAGADEADGASDEATNYSAEVETNADPTTEEEAATTSSDDAGIMSEPTEVAEETTQETIVQETVAEQTETVEQTEVAAETQKTVTEAMQTEEATQAAETVRATTESVEPTTVADAANAATGGLPPGLVFFAGGLVVLAALGVAWYLREQ